PANTNEIFLALGATIREKHLPPDLFEDLLSAFRQDVTVTRYASWVDVTDYCRRSANPVGRLVLRIADYRDGKLDGWSDAICTALQLTNFWQDLKIDFDRGRVYIPEAEMRVHGASRSDLASSTMTPAWTRAMAAAVSRTRALFHEGLPLCDAVRGRLKYELRATWLGGTRILDRVERAEYDMIHRRPSLGVADAPWFAWRLLSWSSSES
ncbi:MAG TPA: squalene/phytoene synthase family protein, partial [Vicinamibacterales bacterium]|nr:squalene/phytoene synthase family protein [Vicinamibacterales bacterium]